jgi:hypothetical protein
VGEREVFTLTVRYVQAIESEQWGTSYLYKLTDAAGNGFKWFASREQWNDAEGREWQVGDTYTVKASVKAHDEYKGRKETSLSRVALHVEKPKPERKSRAKKAKGGADPSPEATPLFSVAPPSDQPHDWHRFAGSFHRCVACEVEVTGPAESVPATGCTAIRSKSPQEAPQTTPEASRPDARPLEQWGNLGPPRDHPQRAAWVAYRLGLTDDGEAA